MKATLRVALMLAASLVLLPSCRRDVVQKQDAGPSPSALPPDHLATNEVPEGKERAFGFPLPVAIRISARFPDSMQILTAYTPEDLANYVRSRVKEGKTVAGTSVTRFDDAVPTADPTKRLVIEVRRAPMTSSLRSELVVRDVTPKPVVDSDTPAERMRKAGLTPDGKLLDPKHMQ